MCHTRQLIAAYSSRPEEGPHVESEQSPCLIGGQRAGAVAFGRKSLQRLMRRTGMRGEVGQRDAVLTRDGNRCAAPGCTTLKRGKRWIAVYHSKPGNSDPKLMMITLCLACHARVTRTQYLQKEWPPLLRTLWREQHPKAHEQTALNFSSRKAAAKRVPLFPETTIPHEKPF